MSENEWKIERPGAHCKMCNAAFEPEQAYYSLLFLNGGGEGKGLVRSDICANCFRDKRPENVFYFWKTALPQADAAAKKPRTVVDPDHVFEFFKRLEGETTGQKVAFRYILALMLSRKKLLQAVEKRKDAEGRAIQIYREKGGGPEHAVIEPELSVEEIAGLSDELGTLLGIAPAARSAEVPRPEGPLAV